MIKFPNLYTQIIYDYLEKHDDELILMKNLQEKYHISQPTIRKYIRWLEKNHYIIRNKRHFQVIPRF